MENDFICDELRAHFLKMKFTALVSGGKDSCYNILKCLQNGHEIISLATLKPSYQDELDSYMYQTVGHEGIYCYSKATNLPLHSSLIKGSPINTDMLYSKENLDEVEDLYDLLKSIKKEENIEGVSCGAIWSEYQKNRLENVCERLDLEPLCYLWHRDQLELLDEMIASGLKAMIIKTACIGLDPSLHLGKFLEEMRPTLLTLHDRYGVNVCGEGGEYETFTTYCPGLFQKRILVEKSTPVILDQIKDPLLSPVGYLKLDKMVLIENESED